MIPPNAGPLPGSLDWTATILDQIRSESGGPVSRFAVRFGKDMAWSGDIAAYARLSCRRCEWQQDWYRARRTWSAAWHTLSVWAGDVMAAHDAACHPPMASPQRIGSERFTRPGPITAATPSDVLRPPAWWGRRFA